MTERIILFEPSPFFSQMDEDLFFEGLSRIGFIKHVRGFSYPREQGGRSVLEATIEPPFDQDALRALVGLYMRYDIDMRCLRPLCRPENEAWFWRPGAYWYEKIFLEPSPTIRPAVASEASVVQALVHAAYGHYIPRIGQSPGPMLDDYDARIAAAQVWVARGQDDVLQGILVLEDQPDGAVLLDNIAVSHSAKGSGIGRALMQFAETEARRRGSTLIRLYTHEKMWENIALYRRIGYVEIRRVTEKGFARVYMEKSLG